MTGLMPNFGRLAKLLEMTTSDHDAEALAAARMANEERGRLGVTWTELLVERLISPQQPSDAAPPTQPPSRKRKPPRTACWTAPDGTKWAVVFTTIFENLSLSDHWVETLDSIQGYYIERGWLTVKQANLVLKFFATAQEREAA